MQLQTSKDANRLARTKQTSLLIALLFCGALLAVTCQQFLVRQAVGDVRKTTSRQTFQSGGARSEIVLREIAGTLKRIESRLEKIDQRMERIEKKQLDAKR